MKKNVWKLSLASLVLANTVYAADSKKEIVAAIDEWCPYNCEAGSGTEGYVVDILRAAFEKNGYKFKYITPSWSKSIDMVIKGKADVTFGVGYYGSIDEGLVTDAPEDISGKDSVAFVKKKNLSILMGVGRQEYYGVKGKKADWDKKLPLAENLKNYKVGLQQDYDYGEEVSEFVKKYPKSVLEVGGTDPLGRLMKISLKGRVNLIPEDKNVFDYKAKELKLASKFSSVAFPEDEYFGDSHLLAFFSPKDQKRSQKLVNLVKSEIKKMRKSGELKKILSKYGLKDWK